MFRKRVRVEKDLHDIQHGVVFDPNRDISGTTEAYKRRHLMDGDPQLCMERMSVETFGYHPRSLVCARCPLAQACAGRLQASVNFDILALRRGEITAQQAVRQVAVYR